MVPKIPKGPSLPSYFDSLRYKSLLYVSINIPSSYVSHLLKVDLSQKLAGRQIT